MIKFIHSNPHLKYMENSSIVINYLHIYGLTIDENKSRSRHNVEGSFLCVVQSTHFSKFLQMKSALGLSLNIISRNSYIRGLFGWYKPKLGAYQAPAKI